MNDAERRACSKIIPWNCTSVWRFLRPRARSMADSRPSRRAARTLAGAARGRGREREVESVGPGAASRGGSCRARARCVGRRACFVASSGSPGTVGW